jgi:hypothetical protein
MAGLVPAIHVFIAAICKDVDARLKAGHDDDAPFAWEEITLPIAGLRERRKRKQLGQGAVVEFDDRAGDAALDAILDRAGDPPLAAAACAFGDDDCCFQKTSIVTLP